MHSFQFPIMLCVLGGKQKNSHSLVAKKNKNELRKICMILELPSEKLGKSALINIVCDSLKIPTSCSKPNARDSNADMLFTSGDVEVPGARFSKVPVTLRARNQIFKTKYKE